MRTVKSNLIIPDEITIQLTDKNGHNLRLENVLIEIITKATYRNNIKLNPFKSNKDGLFVITKNDLLKEAEQVYRSGVMDYVDIETANPKIEIKVMSSSDVQRIMKYHKETLDNSGKNLQYLKDRMNQEQFQDFVTSVEEHNQYLKKMLIIYEASYNKSHQLDSRSIYDQWDKTGSKSYTLEANI